MSPPSLEAVSSTTALCKNSCQLLKNIQHLLNRIFKLKVLLQVEGVDPPELRDGQGVADPKDRLLLLVKKLLCRVKTG